MENSAFPDISFSLEGSAFLVLLLAMSGNQPSEGTKLVLFSVEWTLNNYISSKGSVATLHCEQVAIFCHGLAGFLLLLLLLFVVFFFTLDTHLSFAAHSEGTQSNCLYQRKDHSHTRCLWSVLCQPVNVPVSLCLLISSFCSNIGSTSCT